jgi:hypothetical protein
MWSLHCTVLFSLPRVLKIKNAYKIIVIKPEGKRPLRRSSHRWKSNIKTEFKEIGYECGLCSTHSV